tara:strand:+ start:4784 stop:5044 length:261 start_codon:yes stop_codon:yes gene_type:complete
LNHVLFGNLTSNHHFFFNLKLSRVTLACKNTLACLATSAPGIQTMIPIPLRKKKQTQPTIGSVENGLGAETLGELVIKKPLNTQKE